MLLGIISAVLAGVMLGLYALPEKFTKECRYENIWGAFFFLSLLVVPAIVAVCVVDNFFSIVGELTPLVLFKMACAAFVWGVGVQLWSKAIDYIGVSLGFSIFIGTVILVGSLLPFVVDGLPSIEPLTFIMAGIVAVLCGVAFNALAGMLRQNKVIAGKEHNSGKATIGIIIAVIGGLCAAGFSFANAVGAKPIGDAVAKYGNPSWNTALVVMVIIYVAGAIFVIPYFLVALTKAHAWSGFVTTHWLRNLSMASIMAVLNFSASAVFAYSAFNLGKAGNTVGYAIYNTVSLVVAVIGGIIAKEWAGESSKAKGSLAFALVFMIIGVVFIAVGNSFVK